MWAWICAGPTIHTGIVVGRVVGVTRVVRHLQATDVRGEVLVSTHGVTQRAESGLYDWNAIVYGSRCEP